MARIILGLFDSVVEAEQTVHALVQLGISSDHISLVLNEKADIHGELERLVRASTRIALAKMIDADIAAAARQTPLANQHLPLNRSAGSSDNVEYDVLWGGPVGVLAGLALLTIPGAGPIIAAGPIASALMSGLGGASLSAGGLAGGLARLGVPAEEATLYAEGVVRSGTLIAATLPATDVTPVTLVGVSEILQQHKGTHIRWHDSGPDGERPARVANPDRARRSTREPISLRILAYLNPAHHVATRTVPLDLLAAPPEDDEIRQQKEKAIDDAARALLEELAQSKIAMERLDADCDMGASPTPRPVDRQTPRSNEEAYRSHFASIFGSTSGISYAQYRRAYQFGGELAWRQRFDTEQSWALAAAVGRREWDAARFGGSWETFQDSIRYAWSRARGSAAGGSSH